MKRVYFSGNNTIGFLVRVTGNVSMNWSRNKRAKNLGNLSSSLMKFLVKHFISVSYFTSFTGLETVLKS